MRIILMFDLPSVEKNEKKDYQIFHKELIKNGYFMMQYSVYCKPINFTRKIKTEVEKLRKKIPKQGNVRVLMVTEKQYEDMYIILGNKNANEIYNNSERYVKI